MINHFCLKFAYFDIKIQNFFAVQNMSIKCNVLIEWVLLRVDSNRYNHKVLRAIDITRGNRGTTAKYSISESVPWCTK